MIKLAQAQADLLASLNTSKSVPLNVESVPLLQALGRVAAQDVFSEIQIPPTDNSAMDGFAVNSADFNNFDGVVDLLVSQRIAAGAVPVALKAGSAARIFTGAVIPEGADAVVIQENCEFGVSDQVRFKVQAKSGDNIRPAGQDIAMGAKVIFKGQKLNAIDLSLLASIGHAEVLVYSKIKIAIFSTGDELAEPGQALKEGQIYNSNRPLLMALCRQMGFEAVDCGIVEDTLDATKSALLKAARSSDVIISSGGVSVGEEDHVKPAVEQLGSLDLWKVQMKPGKPVAFGRIEGKPFLGLPGNPVSSFVVFQLLGSPLLRAVQGELETVPTVYSVKSGFDKKVSSREEYIRVRLERNETGELVAQRFANLSSGVMSSLSWADGLVRQNCEQEISVGSMVQYLPLTDAML